MKRIFISVLMFGTLLSANVTSQEAASTKEIQNIVDHELVKKAFEFIMGHEKQKMADLIMLTEIPAPPFKEEVRAAKFADMLREAGLTDVTIDEVGNVIGRRPGTKGDRTIVLEGHLDTVFPEGTDVSVRVSGDTLFAPGVGDDTSGLMVVLSVLRAMQSAEIETEDDVLFIGTVGEEGLGDLRGVKHILRDGGIPVDSWIAVDGGDISRIVTGGLGSYRYRVTFRGPGGHSWGAFGIGNTHHAMGRAITYFTDEADKFTSSGPRTSYNVGVIGGGTSINSVPFESWMEIDMRSVSPESLDKIDTILKDVIQRALVDQNALNRSGAKMTVEVDRIGTRPSGRQDKSMTLVQRAMASSAQLGGKPSLSVSSTNANIPISKGIPAVTIGRGGAGGGGHSITEWWANIEGHLSVKNALLITLTEAKISNKKIQ